MQKSKKQSSRSQRNMRATREESVQPLKTFIYDNRVHKNINAVLKSGDPKGHYLDYIVDYGLLLLLPPPPPSLSTSF
jgi:hypothetical protein